MADYATLLRDHVSLEVRCVDRFFLQGYIPKLQTVGMVCRFLRWQRHIPIPSSAAFGNVGDAYVKDIQAYAKANGLEIVHFKKGENKEQIARPLIDAAAAEGGDGKVVLRHCCITASPPRRQRPNASEKPPRQGEMTPSVLFAGVASGLRGRRNVRFAPNATVPIVAGHGPNSELAPHRAGPLRVEFVPMANDDPSTHEANPEQVGSLLDDWRAEVGDEEIVRIVD
ncbi:MAG: hypothetical protein M3256_27360, partial [Actinomycetota bacterium]|nr:hypothetical protein [Actinomycetota bacterium]